MNSLGVFIRSVGERTEALCRQAVAAYINKDHIHVIRDRTPAWQAYEEMFRMAEEREYAWYLGLDADVVLTVDWFSQLTQKQRSLNVDRVYDCSFPVVDYFFGVVDKGNHLFNGRFTDAARRILQQRTKNSIKPESGIFRHLPDQDSLYFQSLKPLGWHGYEQYNRDLYHRFFVLGARGKRLPQLPDTADRHVAQLAWTAGKRLFQRKILQRWFGSWQGPTPDTSIRNRVTLTSFVSEKSPLNMSLTDFREQYGADLSRAVPRAGPAYDLNRGTIKIPV